MKIGGLQKFSLVDYPERIACTVFFAGCSFRCPWCHNPELVIPEKIKNQPLIGEDEVFSFLEERRNDLEGVCLTGGEPTIDADLFDFCERVKNLGYDLKLDTNGSNPRLLEELVKNSLVDYVAMDIKAPPEKYGLLTGMKSFFGDIDGGREEFWRERILGNIEWSIDLIKKAGVDYEFRTTVVPGLLTKEDLVELAKWIAPASKFIIQEFRPGDNVDKGFEPDKTKEEFLTDIYKAVDPLFDECRLRRAY